MSVPTFFTPSAVTCESLACQLCLLTALTLGRFASSLCVGLCLCLCPCPCPCLCTHRMCTVSTCFQLGSILSTVREPNPIIIGGTSSMDRTTRRVQDITFFSVQAQQRWSPRCSLAKCYCEHHFLPAQGCVPCADRRQCYSPRAKRTRVPSIGTRVNCCRHINSTESEQDFL